jgi:phosphohistidine phosphatase
MLTLMLLRHAKSSWTQIGSTDFERPLNERGTQTAPLIGRYIAANNLAPAQIYCSTARRAKTTAQLVLAEIPGTPEPVYVREIYDGGPESLFNTIASTPNGLDPVLVVGHNPTIHGLCLSLCRGGNGEALHNMSIKYPTGGLAIMDFDHENWNDIAGGSGRLRDFITPRALGPADS